MIKTANKGMAFDQIAVLWRSPEQYEPPLEEAFRRTAVLAYFSSRVIQPDPAGRAFLAMLLCAMEDCSASRFAEYLSLAQVPLPDHRIVDPIAMEDEEHVVLRLYEHDGSAEGNDETAESDAADDRSAIIRGTLQAPTHWEYLIVGASVVGGAERWERRMKTMAAEFQLKLSATTGIKGKVVFRSGIGPSRKFMAKKRTGKWRVNVVSAAGDAREELVTRGEDQGVPTWSADRRYMFVGDLLRRSDVPQISIHISAKPPPRPITEWCFEADGGNENIAFATSAKRRIREQPEIY